MKIAMHGIREITEEQARYINQLGVTHVNLNQHWPTQDGPFLACDELRRLRERVESFGLQVAALENVPIAHYDKLMLGLPGREQQLENLQKTITNVGRAGIPIFGFHFLPSGVWRTNRPLSDVGHDQGSDKTAAHTLGRESNNTLTELPRSGRGGAAVSTFDYELVKDAPLTHGRVYTEDEMWENFTFLIRGIMPTAEEAGVKIAMHPDDPLVPSLGGIARPFRSLEAFERAREIADSQMFGLTFCLGNWALMGSEDMYAGLESFGRTGQLHYVHFQAVRGVRERFEEVFFDESEVFPSVVRALRQVGFEGAIVPAHAPSMGEDQGHWEYPWERDLMGLTHSVGYLQGLLRGSEEVSE